MPQWKPSQLIHVLDWLSGGRVRAIVAKIDEVPDQLLLLGCAGLAGFVMVAHGGALLVRHLAPPDQAAMATTVARYSIPVAGMMLVTAALGLLKQGWRATILALHGVILVVSSFALVAWAGTIIVRGIPEGRFAWTPGLLTAWVWFSFYVFRRFTLPARWSTVLYLPIIAAAIALPIDVGVLVRVLGKVIGS